MNRFLRLWSLACLFFCPFVVGAGEASFVGSASCASSNCHGGTAAKKNEFTIWANEDKHARAFRVLYTQKSKIMASLLETGRPATESAVCLKCHSLDAPGALRGAKFDLQDGVGCESCHGAAGGWLEPHSREGTTHAQSVALGLYDNRNLKLRAEKCLSCHGVVDHKLLAAGHPDVIFELDTFSAAMPKHWKEKESRASARAWVLGQALNLQDSMQKMKERIDRDHRLDESDRNCFSCHHNIYDVSWPLDSGSGRGKALWNPSRFFALDHFLKLAFPDAEPGLSQAAQTIATAFAADNAPSLSDVSGAAHDMAEKVASLQPQLEKFYFSDVFLLRLVALIADDEAAYRKQGFRVAEQGLMAVDALTLALPSRARTAPLRGMVKKLYDILDVKDPARYDPETFASAMKSLGDRARKGIPASWVPAF